MRQDQIERLQEIAEQVAEVFLEETDPQNWTGSGQMLVDMDKDTRGGRYWDKKNAIQTGTLLARVLDLRDRDARSVDTKTPEDDSEKEISKFEKQAKEMVNAAIARATSKG